MCTNASWYEIELWHFATISICCIPFQVWKYRDPSLFGQFNILFYTFYILFYTYYILLMYNFTMSSYAVKINFLFNHFISDFNESSEKKNLVVIMNIKSWTKFCGSHCRHGLRGRARARDCGFLSIFTRQVRWASNRTDICTVELCICASTWQWRWSCRGVEKCSCERSFDVESQMQC